MAVPHGFTILKAAAYIGLGCGLLALVSGVLAARKRRLAGVMLSFLALIVLLDIGSVSRVGVSDVGTNAKRIRTLMEKISHQAKS